MSPTVFYAFIFTQDNSIFLEKRTVGLQIPTDIDYCAEILKQIITILLKIKIVSLFHNIVNSA